MTAVPFPTRRVMFFVKERLLVGTSLVVLAAAVVAAVAGTWIAPYNPGAQNPDLGTTGPSGAHWLGTDELGRDVLSRLLDGAHTALVAPVIIAVGITAGAAAIGLYAGYRRGWPDTVIMRGTDLMLAMPALLLLIVVVGVVGGGQTWAVVMLIVIGAPGDVWVIRGLALAQRELAYVDAARTLGLSDSRIMFRHILPNLAPTVTSNLLLNFVDSLVALSGLSFLGIGLPAGTPDWGLMIEENRNILDVNPWASVAPAVLITVTATAATLLGDFLFERMSKRGERR